MGIPILNRNSSHYGKRAVAGVLIIIGLKSWGNISFLKTFT